MAAAATVCEAESTAAAAAVSRRDAQTVALAGGGAPAMTVCTRTAGIGDPSTASAATGGDRPTGSAASCCCGGGGSTWPPTAPTGRATPLRSLCRDRPCDALACLPRALRLPLAHQECLAQSLPHAARRAALRRPAPGPSRAPPEPPWPPASYSLPRSAHPPLAAPPRPAPALHAPPATSQAPAVCAWRPTAPRPWRVLHAWRAPPPSRRRLHFHIQQLGLQPRHVG